MPRKFKAVLASVAVVGGLFTYSSIAGAGSESGSSDPLPTGRETITSCRGGIQEAVQVITNNFPVNRGEGGFVDIPNVVLNQFVPANDSDLFVLTFSSESELTGAGPNDPLEIRATVNGNPLVMTPTGPNTYVEGTNNTAVQNSQTWCVRLSGGSAGTNYQVRAQWAVTDLGANNVVTAQLDDTAFHLEVSN